MYNSVTPRITVYLSRICVLDRREASYSIGGAYSRAMYVVVARYCYRKSSVRLSVTLWYRRQHRTKVVSVHFLGGTGEEGVGLDWGILMTRRKCFRLVIKSTTLDDLEGPLWTLFRFKTTLKFERLLVHSRRNTCSPAQRAAVLQLQHNVRWSVVMNMYAQAAGGAYRRHILE